MMIRQMTLLQTEQLICYILMNHIKHHPAMTFSTKFEEKNMGFIDWDVSLR